MKIGPQRIAKGLFPFLKGALEGLELLLAEAYITGDACGEKCALAPCEGLYALGSGVGQSHTDVFTAVPPGGSSPEYGWKGLQIG